MELEQDNKSESHATICNSINNSQEHNQMNSGDNLMSFKTKKDLLLKKITSHGSNGGSNNSLQG